MIEAGVIALLGVVFLLIKLKNRTIKWLLGYDLYVDIVITVFFTWLLAGTYSGMMAALVAGVAFSILLYIVKLFVGYGQYLRNRCDDCGKAYKVWVEYPPKFLLGRRNTMWRFHDHHCKAKDKIRYLQRGHEATVEA